ncbi:MFS transporter [Haloferula sp. BvORR071]|uniref:MFS transporter n=1 Tax=Haloferula sp. BvORR071 TaxID=1396141 RepID=UPI002240FD8E|nr:MFS transporter [Haloferula sp. BvORR071]
MAAPLGPAMNLYPLKGLPQQKQIWSWISYDVANQSFTLIVNTMLFSIFFGKIIVTDKAMENQLWAIAFAGSMLVAAFVSPLVGAVADERRCKKAGLIVTGVICSVCTCGLYFLQPGQVWLALLLYMPANFAFAIGENFLASFLPTLARQNEVGRVSAFSWGLAYFAALFLLAVTAVSMKVFKVEEVAQWRPFFMMAGLWFLAFTVPTLLWLREPEIDTEPHSGKNLIAAGYVRLMETCKHLRSFRDLAILMVASFFFATGTNVVVSFASKLASEYGFTQVDLVIFMAIITISGILGTFLPMLCQDRLGHRFTSVVLALVWILASVGFAYYAHRHDAFVDAGGKDADFAKWPLWVIGNLLGFGLGSLGSANRAFVGYLSPPEKSAEMFGIWGLMIKLAAVMTYPFAWVKDKSGSPQALLLLAGLIVIGLVLTCFIDEKRGHAAAIHNPS